MTASRPVIKQILGISRARNRANLMAELGIHRTTDLILWAVKKGLVHLS